jgi:hypothetical protein
LGDFCIKPVFESVDVVKLVCFAAEIYSNAVAPNFRNFKFVIVKGKVLPLQA